MPIAVNGLLLRLLFPGAHVLDAKGRRQIGIDRHAEPIRHRLAVENQIKRLVPVGVLHGMNELPVHVPAQLVMAPIKTIDMELLGENLSPRESPATKSRKLNLRCDSVNPVVPPLILA